ncbi:CBS domain-containing protein [Nocardiopsis sp. RSe5-2]|uniref:CBS domain-containing protein n=1 Tax=Nocardiopsis endophytica TaxID=3018445 RepID=A0ABT4U3M7_9ACTN|nr:CBS domain-containing protein [Nocardiopsis endophytica]MDA2811563.1 CBS domain-containing protein [Nocardiopsis endophytica]
MAETVREVMTTPPYTVAPGTPLRDVARIMRDKEVGDVLIAQDGRLHGLVTDRDITVRCVAEGADCSTETVDRSFTGQTVTVGPDTRVTEAVRLMREHSIRRLPVVEEDRPLGVVSLGDLALERDPRSALADISAAEPNNM